MVGYFTISHTGTQYFRKYYFGERGASWKELNDPSADDVVFAHCNSKFAEAIKNFNGEIITTYRDPLLVAVSWYARQKFINGYEPWRVAWTCWAESVAPRASKILRLDKEKGDVINSVTHNSLVHYLHKSKNFVELFKLIDPVEVLWAKELSSAYL